MPGARCGNDTVPIDGFVVELDGMVYVATPRAIEDVQQGDLVLSRSDEGSEHPLCATTVEDAYERTVDEIVWLTIETEAGERFRLGVTDKHPIWVEDTGGAWVPLADTTASEIADEWGYVPGLGAREGPGSARRGLETGAGSPSVRSVGALGYRSADAGSDRAWSTAADSAGNVSSSRAALLTDAAAAAYGQRGWVHAGELQAGFQLASPTGEFGARTVVDVVVVSGLVAVYNLTAARSHTYFVGAHPTWAHNARACSRILSRNLGEGNRKAGEHAHHIVAGRAEGAQKARDVLRRFGIDINNRRNGVFLPGNLSAPNPRGAAVHSTLHTKAYYEMVNAMLGAATTRRGAVNALNQIRRGLLAWPTR